MVDDRASGQRTDASSAVPPGTPRPEELLSSQQLADLGEVPTTRLRELRAACEEAEEGVSYARRLLQGRLDLLRAELERRDDPRSAELLDSLPSILAASEQPTDPLHARSTRVRVPAAADAHAALLEDVVPESMLTRIDTTDPDELRAVVAAAASHEQALSSLRRALFERIDGLRDELAARYKDGRADVADLLG